MCLNYSRFCNMISVMSNDFDLERNQAPASEVEEPRVSNDGVNQRDERKDDLNLTEETRVFTGHDLDAQKNDIDEGGILPGPGQEGDDARVWGANCCLNEDSGNLVRFEGSSGSDDSDSDIEIEFRVQDREGRYLHEGLAAEAVAVNNGVDRIEERENLGSTSDFDAGDDGTKRSIAVCNTEAMHMTATDDDSRLKRDSDLQASMSCNVGANVRRDGAMKVLGSQFEMGDMVWGKVKSHPWWPGHIYNVALASSSVRRTKRDGHVLVAFFGDSSYGWFDPTELIPYELHYAEKSQQTNSRNFVRAVEESVDEASRRSALGLSCRCRNPYNFRPVSVPGHMAVDVVDYDSGAIYSVSQIQKARESFVPAEALSFIKQLAVAPNSWESKSLLFIKHRATALAYRRSIFEEFDETYAQAFGQQPVRPSALPPSLTDKEPYRAPLSGPLVMAEALGGRKRSIKVSKSKEPSKKDKYLFKRRDEAGEMRTTCISQIHASSSSSSAYEDGTSDSGAASYVFQKRDQAVSVEYEMAGSFAADQIATSAHAFTAKDVPASGLNVTISVDATSDSVQSESSAVVTVKASEVGQVPDGQINSAASAHPGDIGISSDLVKKKKKAVKRSAGQRRAEKPDLPEKKKKKIRKIDGERSMEHPDRLSSGSTVAYVVKPEVRSMQIIDVVSGENSELSRLKKDTEVSNSVTDQLGSSVPLDGDELPQMLADLHGLALNPVHGAERNQPAIVRQFFLKFRSLVFLKSSTASPPSESEPSESQATRFTPLAEESCKTVPPSKPSKLSARLEDPTKAGRKRVPSENQEDLAAKRTKKITEVKSWGAEKKSLLKNPENERADGKAKVGGAQQPLLKPTKAEQRTKRGDRPPRVEEPTYLVMHFQSGSSLPSLVELKARFARFGPLDISLSRVFYKTNTCRVAFLYKQDANVAYRYAVGNKSVFSNVKFMLRPVAAPETQQPSSSRPEDVQGEPPSNQDSSAMKPRPPVVQQQLKSCLKKPSVGDETGANSKATRVRFNMGEDTGGGASSSISNRGVGGVQVQQTESRNGLQSSSEGCPSSLSLSSSVAMNAVSNNQRFISSHPLQLPPQFRGPPRNHPYVGIASRYNNLNHNLIATSRPPGLQPLPPPLPPPSANTDISQQMMSLLTRCHEVVTHIKGFLGYMPYHPL